MSAIDRFRMMTTGGTIVFTYKNITAPTVGGHLHLFREVNVIVRYRHADSACSRSDN